MRFHHFTKTGFYFLKGNMRERHETRASQGKVGGLASAQERGQGHRAIFDRHLLDGAAQASRHTARNKSVGIAPQIDPWAASIATSLTNFSSMENPHSRKHSSPIGLLAEYKNRSPVFGVAPSICRRLCASCKI